MKFQTVWALNAGTDLAGHLPEMELTGRIQAQDNDALTAWMGKPGPRGR